MAFYYDPLLNFWHRDPYTTCAFRVVVSDPPHLRWCCKEKISCIYLHFYFFYTGLGHHARPSIHPARHKFSYPWLLIFELTSQEILTPPTPSKSISVVITSSNLAPKFNLFVVSLLSRITNWNTTPSFVSFQ